MPFIDSEYTYEAAQHQSLNASFVENRDGESNVLLVERVTSTLTTRHSMLVLSKPEIIRYCMIISSSLDVLLVSWTDH
jgi:hypothetical protein